MRAPILALTILLNGASLAWAQEADDVSFLQRDISDQAADQVLNAVTANIHHAAGDNGEPLPPMTEAQRASPLLDRALVREVMDIGLASGIGQVCGLDWQGLNFRPLMARERARGDRSPHQLAAIAMVHGVLQSQVAAGGGACGPQGATGAATFYERKWGASND